MIKIKTEFMTRVRDVDVANKLNEQFINVKIMLDENKKEIISQVDALEQEIDNLRSKMIKEHIKRLEEGVCKPSNSGTYINLVSNLERAGDHLAYVAHSVVEDHTSHY